MNSLPVEKPQKPEPPIDSRKWRGRKKPIPPPSSQGWLWHLLKLLSTCGSMDLHRQIGPDLRPELIERKEKQRWSF